MAGGHCNKNTKGIKYRCQLGLEIINSTRLKTSLDNNKPKMFNAA